MSTIHVSPKKGLVPELPTFETMLQNPPLWIERLKEIQYMTIRLLRDTYHNIDDMTADEANKTLQNMAEGLKNPSRENGEFFRKLERNVCKKNNLSMGSRGGLSCSKLWNDSKKPKRSAMTVEQKKKDDVWQWFNEIVWNVEKVRMLKNESSYSEPKDHCDYCREWAADAKAQWLFSSRKRKRGQ